MKNYDPTRNVYENKGMHDKVSGEKHVFYAQ